MSAAEHDGPRADRRRPAGAEGVLTLALAFALLAACGPLLTVVSAGPWVGVGILFVGGLLLIGFGLRRLRAPGALVSALLLACWAVFVTTLFFPHASIAGFFPDLGTVEAASAAARTAAQELYEGVAPVTATPALSFLIVAAAGLLTVVFDHVVITTRMPVLALIALVAVWLIPGVAVQASAGVLSFALLAVCALGLVRAETATREVAETGGRGGATAAAIVSVGAIVIALTAAPMLRTPVFSGVAGAAGGVAIDASLDLGEDLRRPVNAQVLTMRSSATVAPYLRVATLSRFEGDVWLPDQLSSLPLDEAAMEPVVVADGIRVTEHVTSVRITQLASAWLPIPFPAVAADGLHGSWRTVPYNRTLLGDGTTAQGQDYQIVTHVPQPTLEQVRAAQARLDPDLVALGEPPADLPPVIAELAALVTADAQTDFDRLDALQSWFRGSDFSYSLDTPVEAGFDGSGVEAVARFLEVREGYCVHFASAFTLMARSLGIPTRIVVGFLPGPLTGQSVDGESVLQVTTDQFHAWPEAYFEGIGWIGFEPTQGLGVETRFESESSPAPDDGGDEVVSPTPTPTVAPTTDPTDVDPGDVPAGGGGEAARAADLRPFVVPIVVVAIVALLPFVVGRIRLALWRRRARRGQIGAAWRIVQDAAIDLGDDAPGAETPRAFGARLVTERGAPDAATARLVSAIELAGYARDARVDTAHALDDAERVRAGMLAAAGGRRVAAALFPRSLVRRPGR
ncbi:transglutaminase family protein [Microbacterium sp. No. 7]|uniref:transglutaminase family protein n=1 Tax=Microbacterium sp. No. 7 TaxID=1714373 RepID=UPI0006D137BF|nr:DUF3488 and transglutaminase-like domain-containing protein [Microbacterium sp. No. 7]ALJ19446.1 hypothetical protein AOA12_05805 [Microbacterium sp. No. 7]